MKNLYFEGKSLPLLTGMLHRVLIPLTFPVISRSFVLLLVFFCVPSTWAGTDNAPHTITAGTSGDASLTIVADTDNNNEGDNAYLKFLQDGGLTGAIVGFDEATGGGSNTFKIAALYNGNITGNQFTLKTSNGRIGIGTDSPAYKLDVNGSLRSNGFHTASGVLYIRPQNSTNEGGHLQWQRANSGQGNWNMDHYNGNLRIYMSGGNTSHYFHSNGNVGLGTSSPDYRLDVNGAIRAKEFFVETGWSDFVFEDDYQLPSLDEVEAHIADYGHLPGVPSAAEIQANGLEMGQAQTIMMQKIEELTLYVLEAKKENESLRARVLELEARQAAK